MRDLSQRNDWTKPKARWLERASGCLLWKKILLHRRVTWNTTTQCHLTAAETRYARASAKMLASTPFSFLTCIPTSTLSFRRLKQPRCRSEIKWRRLATVLAKTCVRHLDHMIIVRGDRHLAQLAPVNRAIRNARFRIGWSADHCVSCT